MKRFLLLICLFLHSMFTGCESDTGDYIGLGELGIDKSKGHLNSYIDTHGGFLGDGCTYIEIEFSGDYAETIETELQEEDMWRAFPLSKNLQTVVYGDEEFEAFLSISDDIPSIPEIINGYFYFKDRHSDSTDSSDEANILSRYSFNFDIIIYDVDEHILYIFQLDT